MESKYKWVSSLGNEMQMFLKLKRMSGFKYEREGRLMEMFDKYCCETGFSGKALTRKLVDGFCYGIYYEKDTTRYNKEKLLSGFGEYLCQNGYKSYICPKISAPKKRAFKPYIYSEEELDRFFKAIDRYPAHPLSNRDLVDPLMFRMIYGCGLRLSEALNLKLEDIDTREGTITILQAKNNKDRKIPMADSLTKRCNSYLKDMHIFSSNDTYYFKSPLGC